MLDAASEADDAVAHEAAHAWEAVAAGSTLRDADAASHKAEVATLTASADAMAAQVANASAALTLLQSEAEEHGSIIAGLEQRLASSTRRESDAVEQLRVLSERADATQAELKMSKVLTSAANLELQVLREKAGGGGGVGRSTPRAHSLAGRAPSPMRALPELSDAAASARARLYGPVSAAAAASSVPSENAAAAAGACAASQRSGLVSGASLALRK